MVQIVITILVLTIFDIGYRIVNQRNRKYNYSPIYLRIERIYDKWYSKNTGIISNRKASVTRIRQTIFELVDELREDGLKKKDIYEYDDVINVPHSKSRWYTIVAGILTVIGGNEIVKSIFGDLYKELRKINWLGNQIVSLILYFILLIILVFLFTKFSYILIISDNSKRDNMKKAIFKEVEILYEKDKVNKDYAELRSPFENACMKAFTPIKFEWIDWVEKHITNWLKKPNVLRSIFLIFLLMIEGLLIFVECGVFQLTKKSSLMWIVFIIVIGFIFIFTFFIFDYIHGWHKCSKSN